MKEARTIKKIEKKENLNLLNDKEALPNGKKLKKEISEELSPKERIIPKKKRVLPFKKAKQIFLIKKRKRNNRNDDNQEKKKIKGKTRTNREDNIRRKISRKIFNYYLIDKINKILKDAKSNIYLKKFHSKFTYNISLKSHTRHLKMTINQIISNEEFFKGKNSMVNFNHNLTVINLIKSGKINNCDQNNELNRILDSNFCDLFEQYLSSNEFKNVIEQLKKEKYSDSYIESFIRFSKNFIKNYQL